MSYHTHTYTGEGRGPLGKEKENERGDKNMGLSIMATLTHSRIPMGSSINHLRSRPLFVLTAHFLHSRFGLSHLHSSMHTCFFALSLNPQAMLTPVLSSPFGGSITCFSIVRVYRDSRQQFQTVFHIKRKTKQPCPMLCSIGITL